MTQYWKIEIYSEIWGFDNLIKGVYTRAAAAGDGASGVSEAIVAGFGSLEPHEQRRQCERGRRSVSWVRAAAAQVAHGAHALQLTSEPPAVANEEEISHNIVHTS